MKKYYDGGSLDEEQMQDARYENILLRNRMLSSQTNNEVTNAQQNLINVVLANRPRQVFRDIPGIKDTPTNSVFAPIDRVDALSTFVGSNAPAMTAYANVSNAVNRENEYASDSYQKGIKFDSSIDFDRNNLVPALRKKYNSDKLTEINQMSNIFQKRKAIKDAITELNNDPLHLSIVNNNANFTQHAQNLNKAVMKGDISATDAELAKEMALYAYEKQGGAAGGNIALINPPKTVDKNKFISDIIRDHHPEVRGYTMTGVSRNGDFMFMNDTGTETKTISKERLAENARNAIYQNDALLESMKFRALGQTYKNVDNPEFMANYVRERASLIDTDITRVLSAQIPEAQKNQILTKLRSEQQILQNDPKRLYRSDAINDEIENVVRLSERGVVNDVKTTQHTRLQHIPQTRAQQLQDEDAFEMSKRQTAPSSTPIVMKDIAGQLRTANEAKNNFEKFAELNGLKAEAEEKLTPRGDYYKTGKTIYKDENNNIVSDKDIIKLKAKFETFKADPEETRKILVAKNPEAAQAINEYYRIAVEKTEKELKSFRDWAGTDAKNLQKNQDWYIKTLNENFNEGLSNMKSPSVGYRTQVVGTTEATKQQIHAAMKVAMTQQGWELNADGSQKRPFASVQDAFGLDTKSFNEQVKNNTIRHELLTDGSNVFIKDGKRFIVGGTNEQNQENNIERQLIALESGQIQNANLNGLAVKARRGMQGEFTLDFDENGYKNMINPKTGRAYTPSEINVMKKTFLEKYPNGVPTSLFPDRKNYESGNTWNGFVKQIIH